MELKKLTAAAGSLALVAGLVACGGGGGDGGNGGTANPSLSDFVYASALASANSQSGLQNSALKESFDARYLDGGTTKTMVTTSVDAEASAAGADATYSFFPQLTLTGTSLTDCNADGVCTLTGTLTNNDADATSVPFSVRVVQSGGMLKLYGNQQAS